MRTLLVGLLVLMVAVPAFAADDAKKAKEAIARHDAVVKRADAQWRQQVLTAKKTLVTELVSIERDGATDARMREEAASLRRLEEIKFVSSLLAVEKKPDDAPNGNVEMYDAMKEPNPLNGGLPMHESTLRPRNPEAAYNALANGMKYKDALAVLGGWQSDSARDGVRHVVWVFNTASGGDTTITATFEGDNLTSFSRSRR